MPNADTTAHRVFEKARTRANIPAFYRRDAEGWVPTTWGGYAARVRAFAKGLIALGHEGRAPISILGFNNEEWCVSCVAAMAAGSAAAGIYTTSSPEECRYILEHSESFAVVVENGQRWREQIRPIQDKVPTLRYVILMQPDPEAEGDEKVKTFAEVEALGAKEADGPLDERLAAITSEDTGSLIYTSGTTGPPKGVMLSHRALTFTSHAANDFFRLSADDLFVSYLPLSHIAEQMFTIHGPTVAGMPIYFAQSIDKLKDDLVEVRPTYFFAVPRVWEKMHAALAERMRGATGLKKALLEWSRAVALEAWDAKHHGRALGPLLGLRYKLAKRLVLDKIRGALGFDRVRFSVTGAAPISREILSFFLSIDIPIYEVYGQTEDCGPATVNAVGATRIGTVGRAIPGLDVKIAEDGEILVKGPSVFTGYLKNEDATRETMKDGWLLTGDVGVFDEEGFLRITDRKKDLIITAGGKNVAPQNIEAMLKDIPLVGHAVCIGDRRRYIAALVTLEPEATSKWASANGRAGASLADLAKSDAVRAEIQKGVDAMNAELAQVEQVKKFRILPVEFGTESGELTPTMKLKRKVVGQKYADEIEALYA